MEALRAALKKHIQRLTRTTFTEHVIHPGEWDFVNIHPPSTSAAEYVPAASDVYGYEDQWNPERLTDPILGHRWTFCLFETQIRPVVTLFHGHRLNVMKAAVQFAADETGTDIDIHIARGKETMHADRVHSRMRQYR